LHYGYDAAGNVASMRSSNAGGVDVAYAWDAANQLVSVTDNRVSPGMTVSSYGLTGQPALVTAPNGVQASYERDALDRVTKLAYAQSGGSPLASYAYALAPTGHRLSVTELSGRSATYGYDATYKLTSEAVAGAGGGGNGAVAYALDPTGNRLSRVSTLSGVPSATYSYDSNDRLLSDGYDQAGNTVLLDGNTLAYDPFDHLTSKNAGTPGAVLFTYHGDGNLDSKTAGGVTTRYLIDELNPTGLSQIVEELQGGVIQRAYTYGSMLVSQGVLSGGSLQPRYYGYDAHGNVTFLTDESGVVTDTFRYDAFGNLVASTGSTPNEIMYGGQRLDPDVGLYHLRARWYEPGRGRFMTVDPVQNQDLHRPIARNRYVYGNADPTNNIDPGGTTAALAYGVLANHGRRVVDLVSATFQVAVFETAYPIAVAENPDAPFSTVPGKVAAISITTAALGVRGLGITVACEFSLAMSGFSDDLPESLCTQTKKYECVAKCQASSSSVGAHFVYGASGRNCGEATRAAKAAVPRGEYPRHCSCSDTDGFRGVGHQCEAHTR
jgi:RHS repeat-associated protein